MNLQCLALENFRNHKSTRVECSQGINIFLGNNGEGKTNILEGISYLCLSKSFYAKNDTTVTKIGENGFKIEGNIHRENGTEYNIKIQFDGSANKKSIEINKRKIDKLSNLIGQFPIVILTPEQIAITKGSPLNRRQWVDLIISQSSTIYLENLIDYRRILKQRNSVLSEKHLTDREIQDSIEPWDKSLVKVGTELMKRRIEFLKYYQNCILLSYVQLAGKDEQPDITYKPSFDIADKDTNTIAEVFNHTIKSQYKYERRIGYSLVGPHRDDFVFTLNGMSVQSFASQGQHKTLLVALKLAEFLYLKDRCMETPILLLDDVLSELDINRSQRLLEAAAKCGQIFITTTSEHEIDWSPVAPACPRKFLIRQGSIEHVEDKKYAN